MPFDIIRIRRDTFANWQSVNPTLALGEISYDLNNKQIRVGDGTNLWLDLPVIGNSVISDGDKGDIVVSNNGTTWSLDPVLLNTINNKLDQGPLDGGTPSTPDQILQIRRGNTLSWTGVVLGAGEVGYDSEVNEIRIGDGLATWANLDPIGFFKVQNINLQQLGDVDYPTPLLAGQVLTWDGNTWVNDVVPEPTYNLNALTDVVITTLSNTQVLQYNGTNWVNATVQQGAGVTTGSKNEINVVAENNWQINPGVIEQANLNLSTPVNPQDAATKDYTDQTIGLAITANVIDELDQPNGLAVLNSNRYVSTNRLGSGTADSTTYLRGDGTWNVVTSGVTDHGSLSGLLDDDHTQYHNDARGDARYAPISHTHTLSNITNSGASVGQVPTWTGANWASSSITDKEGVVVNYNNTIPAHEIGLDIKSSITGDVYLKTPNGWANITANDGIVELLDTNGTSKGNWKEQSFIGAFTFNPSAYNYSTGDAVVTIAVDENSRFWFRNEKEYTPAGDIPTQSLLANDFIQTWTGNVEQDTVNTVYMIGFNRSHAQSGLDEVNLSQSIERLIGFINTEAGVWRATVRKNPNTGDASTETFGVTTTASITTEHTLQVIICNKGTTARFYVDGVLVGTANDVLPTVLTSGVDPKAFSGIHCRRLQLGNASTTAIIRTKKLSCIKYKLNSILSDKIFPDMIAQAGATPGQVIKWNGTAWAPSADSTGGGITDGDKGDILVSNSGATWTIETANNAAISGGTVTNTSLVTGTYSSPLGETVMKRVFNNTGSPFTKGQVVYVVGSQGDNLTVALAGADSELTAATTIGVTAESIANGASGYIITQGPLTGLSGIDTPFVNGDALWLGSTPGTFTRVRPTQPAHGVSLGWVVRTSNGSAGIIYVKVTNGQELSEIHDVLISSQAERDVLSWDNTAQLWKNRTLSNAGIAAAVHTHPTTDITGLGALATLNSVGSTQITNGAVTGIKIATNTINIPLKASFIGLPYRFYISGSTGNEWIDTYFDSDLFSVDQVDGVTITNLGIPLGKLNSGGATGGQVIKWNSILNQWVAADEQAPNLTGLAPDSATYIVKTPNATLTSEFALSTLGTGLLKNTTGTGDLSIATGSDLPSHTHSATDITGGAINNTTYDGGNF